MVANKWLKNHYFFIDLLLRILRWYSFIFRRRYCYNLFFYYYFFFYWT